MLVVALLQTQEIVEIVFVHLDFVPIVGYFRAEFLALVKVMNV